MRFLCFDVGSKSLGVSISDEKNIIAIPLENYFFEEKDVDNLLKKALALLEKYKITKLLIGYPKKTNGEKPEIAFFIDDFIEKIKQKTNVEIILIDERFSTKRAKELFSSKINKEDLKKTKDMGAAWVMLNDYLSFFKV